jgi:hypothetical protein
MNAAFPFHRPQHVPMTTLHGLLRVLIVTLCLSLVQPFAAVAQANTPAPLPPAAQEVFDKGIVAAREQGYIVAIRYLQDARKLAPQAPQIFRSLGAVEARIPGRELRAMAWYGAYLAALPNAPDAAEVKKEIVRLEVKSQINISGLIRQVQDAASQMSSAYDRDKSLRDVAGLWAKAGDISAALKTVDLIGLAPNFAAELEKGRALQSIASVQAFNGDIAGAKKTAESIREAIYKCQTQRNIAEAQLKAGDDAGAQSTLAAARKTADLIDVRTDGNSQFYELIEVAKAQAEVGDIRGAQQTMEPVADQADKMAKESPTEAKDHGELAIVKAQVKGGDLAGAFKTADRIQTVYLREVAWGDIAEKQLTGGDIAGAQKTVDLLREGHSKSIAQMLVAKAQIKAGHIAGALKTAGMIRDANYKRWTLEAVVKAQTTARDFAGALKSADLMAEGNDKGIAQYDIVRAQSEAGDIAGALKAVDAIQQALWKTFAEVSIANAQIKNGDMAGAKSTLAAAQKTADRIEGADDKASGQKSIAQAQAKAGLANTPSSTHQSTSVNPPSIQSPVAVTAWIEKLDDSVLIHGCPLNTGPFLDLAGYLKSRPPSDGPREVFESLHQTAKTIVGAQNVITGMLKQQATR